MWLSDLCGAVGSQKRPIADSMTAMEEYSLLSLQAAIGKSPLSNRPIIPPSLYSPMEVHRSSHQLTLCAHRL